MFCGGALKGLGKAGTLHLSEHQQAQADVKRQLVATKDLLPLMKGE